MAKQSESTSTIPVIEILSEPKARECIALGWFQSDKALASFAGSKISGLTELEERIKKSGHFSGKKSETSLIRYYPLKPFENVLLVGLGPEKKADAEVFRQVGAAVFLAQKKEKLQRISLDGTSLWGSSKQKANLLQAFCEGYLLAGYEYSDLKKKEKSDGYEPSLEIFGSDGKDLNQALLRAQVMSRAVNFARHLGDRPANYLTPTIFAKLVQEMATKRKMKVKVLGRRDMEKEKMGLFLGVSQGSTEEPQFIIMEYMRGKKGEKPIALIGKGITFDSGGISLKPSSRMEDMKYDMMGAAGVAGMMQAISELDLPVNVVGFIAASENMPGPSAQKPGDIKLSLTGKSVEIINTDAEGRLVLADAMEYAQKYYQPQVMFDFATLTGAVVDALGSITTGIMGNNPELIGRMRESAGVTGERVWELPLYEEYEEDLKSSYADIKNIGTREAGASKAGTFLKFFVDKKLPWVHCDVAGSAYHRKDVNYHPKKYGAGVMVRLVTHLVENWSPLK